MNARAEQVVGGLATAVLLYLHGVLLLHAGGLWRDEANSATVAQLPSLGALWAHMQFDSFPALWFLTLRAWEFSGLGTSDLGIRTLGLTAGCLLLALLWWLARLFEVRAPLFALGLFGFNVAVVIYGDSLRAYGLANAAGLLAFGLIWLVAERASALRVGLALTAALAAVQLVFYGPVYLLAAGLGGIAVALRSRRYRSAAAIVGIGLASALSYLPYRAMFEEMTYWVEIVKYRVDLAWIFGKFVEAVRMNGVWGDTVWVVIVPLAIVSAALAQSRRRCPDLSDRERDVALYCGVTLVVGTLVYIGFLLHLRYMMQPWYFLILMTMVAGCLDGAFQPLLKARSGPALRVAAIALLAVASWSPLADAVQWRKTNLDLVANVLMREARAGDLIVLDPWVLGVTFHRYYHGAAAYTTVPPIAAHDVHRWDLLRRQMETPDAMRPVLTEARRVLRSGHRVWLVGEHLVPAPWDHVTFVRALGPGESLSRGRQYGEWSCQLGELLTHAGKHPRSEQLGLTQPVSAYENPPLTMFEGWRP